MRGCEFAASGRPVRRGSRGATSTMARLTLGRTGAAAGTNAVCGDMGFRFSRSQNPHVRPPAVATERARNVRVEVFMVIIEKREMAPGIPAPVDAPAAASAATEVFAARPAGAAWLPALARMPATVASAERFVLPRSLSLSLARTR